MKDEKWGQKAYFYDYLTILTAMSIHLSAKLCVPLQS